MKALTTLAVVGAVGGLAALAGGQPAVTLEFIGPGGREADISENGQVVYKGWRDEHPAVFRYRDGGGSELIGSGDWGWIGRVRINSAGQVAFGTDRDAYRYTDGMGLENLNTMGADAAGIWDMNESGEVVGQALLAGWGNGAAYRFTDAGGMALLDYADPSRNSGAMSINGAGQVAGFIETRGSMPIRYADDEGWFELGTLGGDAIATRINNRGDVIGWAEPPDAGSHVFLYTDEAGFLDLDTGFANKWPADINNQRWIIANDYGQDDGPKLWTPETGWIGLRSLLPDGADAELTEAWGINDASQIVGNGRIGEDWGVYRLTIHSIPEAPTVAGLVWLGLGALRPRRNSSGDGPCHASAATRFSPSLLATS